MSDPMLGNGPMVSNIPNSTNTSAGYNALNSESITGSIDNVKQEVQTLESAFTNPDGTKTKITGIGKWFTLASMAIILIIGILGNFAFMNFNMGTFNNFVPVFALVLAPFVVSIGADGAIKRFNEGKRHQILLAKTPVVINKNATTGK